MKQTPISSFPKKDEIWVTDAPVEGWTHLRVAEVDSILGVVVVEFLRPKTFWKKGVEGLLSLDIFLKRYREQ